MSSINAKTRQALRIQDLSLMVRLGCSKGERLQPQEVRVSVEIRLFEPPPGETSDALNDTVCYAGICQALRTVGDSKEFQLIEKLAAESLMAVREIVSGRGETAVRIHKVLPPIENLRGGTVYTCGDFLL